MVNLRNFICTNPFTYTEIMQDRQTFCCPQWLEEYIEGETINYKESWHSEKAERIRESMIDGSFKYCSTTKCPHLSTLVNSNILPNGPIKRKNNQLIKQLQENAQKGPKQIKFVFDEACNLACPSCRNSFVKNSESIYVNSTTKLKNLSIAYSNSVEYISMSGAGDPFYSNTFFEFLQNIDIEKFPNLNHIHLHTNAILWNEYNWNKIKNSHSFIKTTEISIDAATNETYKVVRKGGNFDILTRNLKFIRNLEGIHSFNFSFVVQEENYTEMLMFYDYIKSLFSEQYDNGRVTITFTKIQNWGNLSLDKYNQMAIHQDSHPDHHLFLDEVEKLIGLKSRHVITNLQ